MIMNPLDFLCHYGVKGMRWGVRKDDKSPITIGKKFVKNDCQTILNKPYKSIRLSKKEYAHVHSEIQTWMKKQNMWREVTFKHRVGNYIYTVYHDGERGISILSKHKIKPDKK